MNFDSFVKNNSLRILVKPNSKKTEIIGYNKDKGCVTVNVAAPPERNKANIEVVKFFSRILKKKVRIKSGLKGKEKVLVF